MSKHRALVIVKPFTRGYSGGAATVRAHMPSLKGGSPLAGGLPGVLGMRREDKNKWERRAPIAPRHVRELVKQGIRVQVQPCTRRVFTDLEYREVGAEVREDLSECSAIVAVKEVPPDLLLPGRTWCFFSHTIKAQPAGMPLLDAVLEKKVRLVDYECITETGSKGGRRLVAFGAFAGYAGAIDFLRGLGERFLALGFSTPLLHIGAAFMYPSLEEAKRAVSLAGDAIRKHGLPKALCPFTAVFTGTGNVSQGALEIFKLLPHEVVNINKLPSVCGRADKRQVEQEDCHKLYLSIATAEHMARRRDGGPFNKVEYYAEPEHYESIFQDQVLPYCTVILNGMYWDARFPRLFTREDLHRHVVSGRDRLLGVCDITCDADGSVPTRQFASIEQPFHLFNAMTEQVSTSMDGPGVMFHAVDHLPSEVPREASEHFGDCLLPFLPSLVAERAPVHPGPSSSLPGYDDMPMPIRGAIVAEGGALARDFRYIQQLRDVQNKGRQVFDSGTDTPLEPAANGSLRPHGTFSSPPACCKLELIGHLFDTHLINRVTDICEEEHARLQIQLLDVGRSVGATSFLSVLVLAHTDDRLEDVVRRIEEAATKSSVTFRLVDNKAAETAQMQAKTHDAPASTQSDVQVGVQRKVLVLGSGYVARPVVDYLLRRPENAITVASLERSEVEAFTKPYKRRVVPEVVNVGAAQAGSTDAAHRLEELVKASNVVVSLVPAPLHACIARCCITHKVPLITASYVSTEMQALDAEAQEAGVLLLNEVGLDPGIDHLSAMRMIDAVQAEGSEILRFSSLCGGLPAPEVAGANPIGYKFSWSPRGVLMASQNSACYMEAGVLREVAGQDLLSEGRPIMINNAFAMDVLPNRDSTVFAKLYGLQHIPTFFRGTLRFRGYCERMLALAKLGLLQPGPVANLKGATAGQSRRRWLAELLGASSAGPEAAEMLAQPAALIAALRARLAAGHGKTMDQEVGLDFIAWLGLLKDEALPPGLPLDSPIDVVAHLLQRPETTFQPGERDLVVMRHELDARRADGVLERHVSMLVEYGEPNGTTAMSRTVGLTAAICAQLALESPQERFGAGVQRPLRAEWYEPVLTLLEAENIRLTERKEPLFEVQTKAT